MSDWNEAIEDSVKQIDAEELKFRKLAAANPDTDSGKQYYSVAELLFGLSTNIRSLKRPDGGWMPISDNAKDGEVVIVLMQYEQLQKAYAVRWTEYLPGQEGWCAANTYQPLIGTAKFWQPLPAPPHKAAGER